MKFRTVFLLASLLAVTACSKLTRENYELLSAGMDRGEISEILGKPTSCSESMGTQSCIWGDENGKHVKVRFVANAAVVFSNQDL